MARERASGEQFQIYNEASAQPPSEEETPHSSDGSALGLVHRNAVDADPTALPLIEENDSPFAEDVYNIEEDPKLSLSLSSPSRRTTLDDDQVFEQENVRVSLTQSHQSDDISELPDDIPYTPTKGRTSLRSSIIHNAQIPSSPPYPQDIYGVARSPRYKLPTPTRTCTPQSIRSRIHSSPKKSAQKKEYPLVLLHVTLLPLTYPCPLEVMEAVLPPYVLDNYKILRDKLGDTVLERGILLPHPRDDYDLLEERLLESMDLKTPRILKCGHFHHCDDELSHADCDIEEDGYDINEDQTEICDDCGRPVKDGRLGTGEGPRRWDIKIFAANGLMRAGAWGAAWREMERVDAEVMPWLSDEMKRQLELKNEEEEQRQKETDRMREEEHVQFDGHTNHKENDRESWSHPTSAEARLREIYGDSIPPPVPTPPPEKPTRMHRKKSSTSAVSDIPLTVLLQNYIYLLFQDKRNIVLGLLSIAVLFLALKPDPASPPSWPSSSSIHTAAPGFNSVQASRDSPVQSSHLPSVMDSLPQHTSSIVISSATVPIIQHIDGQQERDRDTTIPKCEPCICPEPTLSAVKVRISNKPESVSQSASAPPNTTQTAKNEEQVVGQAEQDKPGPDSLGVESSEIATNLDEEVAVDLSNEL